MLQLSCEFCTMKFPSVQTMFHHIKTTHVDRVNSPNSYIEHFNRITAYSKFHSPSSYHPTNGSPAVDEHYKRKASEERTIIHQDHIKTEQSAAGDLSDNDLLDKRASPVRSASIKQEEEQDIPTDLSKKSISDEEVKSNPDTSITPKPMQQPALGSFLCNQCNAALPDFESFRNHLKNHLSQTTISTFVCQHCGTTLPNQADYERHVYSHFLITNSEYLCNFNCNKAFTKSDDLQKHLLEVHAQSLFKCGICSDLFDTKVAIQVHFAVAHANEVKIYRCSACIEAFKSESDFRHHVKSRHSIPNGAVQCIFCRTVCASELEMHFHLAAHARQYRCPACPESFHVEFLLDRHMQTHHSTNQHVSPKESMYHYKTPQASATAATPTAVATNNNNSSLDYHYTSATAATAGNKNLYGFNNKFYNPLQVDTANSPNKGQMYGFYDALNKSRYEARTEGNTTKNLLGIYNQELASKLYIGDGERDLYPPQKSAPYFSSSRVATKSHLQDTAAAQKVPSATYAQQESENRENGYGCGICEKNDFSTEAEVHTHRKVAHNLKTGVSLRCAYCNGNFRSR